MNTQEYKFGTWYPIEKAPKDGTVILMVSNNWWPTSARWDSVGNGWMLGDDKLVDPSLWPLTHWMPRPPTPAEQEEQDKYVIKLEDGSFVSVSELQKVIRGLSSLIEGELK